MNPHHIHTLRYINKSLSGKAVRQEAGTLHPLIKRLFVDQPRSENFPLTKTKKHPTNTPPLN